MSDNDDSHPKRGELTRRSILLFFLIGGVLLVVPLVIVFSWDPRTCTSTPVGLSCKVPSVYAATVRFLPFVMILGGVIVAFNLKRISDSMRLHEEEEESESGEEEGSSREGPAE